MINNYSDYVKYLGEGNKKNYSFPFRITHASQLRILVFDEQLAKFDYTERADEYLTIDQVKFSEFKAGGEIILKNNLALHKVLIIKLSMNEGVQPYQYREQDDFRLRHFENGLDHVLLHIQRLYEKFTRAITFNEKFSYNGTFDPQIDEFDILAGQYLRTNETATAFELRDFEQDVKAIVRAMMMEAAGVPPSEDAWTVLETHPNEDDELEVGWTEPIVYEGFTERWSEIISLKGLKATLDYIMRMGYAPPNVSLSGSVSTALREKGDTVASVNLTANITRTLNDIVAVRFYRGGTLLDTQTSGGGIPSGGSNSFNVATPFSDNTSFSVQVDDDSAQPKPSRTAGISYSFVYPYYIGSGVAGLNASGIQGLTKLIISQNNNHTYTITVGTAGHRTYYAFPASYGNLSSIIDENGFEVKDSWTARTVSITGLNGVAVNYTVYEGNNPLAATTYQFTFKR